MSQRDVQWGTLLESSTIPHPAITERISTQYKELAIETLSTHDSQRAEAWRYTKLKGFNDHSLHNVSALAQNKPLYEQVTGLRVCRVSELAAESQSLTGINAEAWSWISEQFNSQDTLTLLNHLHVFDGWVIIVEEDINGGHIELRHSRAVIEDTQKNAVCLNAPQVWVYLAPKSQLNLTEYFGNDDSQSTLDISLGGFSLAEDSRLNYTRAQQSKRDTPTGHHAHFGRIGAELEANAFFKMTSLNLGADLCRLEMDVNLKQSGAKTDLSGLYLGSGQTSIDQHLTLKHSAPSCVSAQRFKGAFGGRSKGIFTGRVIVEPGAHTTIADQHNPNLLLSDEARAVTRPQLEIYNDQVECSHGATVGQLDEDALFYLKTRGLSEAEALRALTTAFVGEVRVELTDKQLVNDVDYALLKTLGLKPQDQVIGEEWIDWEQLMNGEG